MEAEAGIEPAIEILQTSALPLGHPAIKARGFLPSLDLIRREYRLLEYQLGLLISLVTLS